MLARKFVGLVVAIALGCSAVADAACVTYPTNHICTPWMNGRTTYEDRLGSFFDPSIVNETFAMLDTTGLCHHCIFNLKTFICNMAFPICESTDVVFTTVRYPSPPSENSCLAAVASCIPPDAPPDVVTIMNEEFRKVFNSIDSDYNDCTNIYDILGGVMGDIVSFGLSTVTTNIRDQYKTTPNCTCDLPSVEFCDGIVDYPVWSVMAKRSASIEALVNESYLASIASINVAPGVACDNCMTQMKKTACTTGFYRCALPRTFVPPCASVYDDAMRACRVDQLAKPGMRQLIERLTGSNSTAEAIQDALAESQSARYYTIASNLTFIRDSNASSPTYNIFYNATSSSTNETLCFAGSYTPERRCPCVNASTNSVCAPHVNWQVWEPVNTNVAGIQNNVTGAFEQLNILCADCYKGVARATCTALFPQCTDDDVIVPACASDCERQVSPCNLNAISQQCNTISSQLPWKAVEFNSCFRAPDPTGNCEYCTTAQPALPQCGKYVQWPTFAVTIPGLPINVADQFLGALIAAQPNLTSCPECTDMLKRMYCSSYTIPCRPEVVNQIALHVLNGGAVDDIGAFLPLLGQPCEAQCQELTRACTFRGVDPFPGLSCNMTKLGGFFDLPFTLFSKDSNCYSHKFTELPPSSCLVPANLPDPPPRSATGSGSGATDGTISQASAALTSSALALSVLVTVPLFI